MSHHHLTGVTGEEMAAKYLLDKGYTILHKNWRHGHWEVDIIASRESKLHFIEVKTRRTGTFGFPEDDVSRKKIKNLIEASEEFLVSISLTNNEPEFFLIEDVYI